MSEYEQAKQRYEECLERLRAISHDFTPEGHRAFLKALEESRRAYTDLFWADQRQKDGA